MIRRRATLTALFAAAVAYSWWAAGLRPYSHPATAAVLVGALGVLVAGPRFERRPTSPPRTRALLPWGALAAAVLALELFTYFQSPRAEYPTMSSLVNEVDTVPVRRVTYVLWFLFGWHLAGRLRGRSWFPARGRP